MDNSAQESDVCITKEKSRLVLKVVGVNKDNRCNGGDSSPMKNGKVSKLLGFIFR